MSSFHFLIKQELQYMAEYFISAFSKKYKNEWLCIIVGLPFLFFYDHPYLIINFLK